MTQKRRKCKLVNSDYNNVDLTQYSDLIEETINKVVPGKNPKVFENHFSTDPLTQGEAVAVGRELAKVPELAAFGKPVTTFRLFDGKTYDSEEAASPSRKKKIVRKGGRKT